MPFLKNTAFAEDVGTMYGEYDSTFTSENGQVHAELFRVNDWLVAHISFESGKTMNDVTDRYVRQLQDHAAEAGFGDRIRLVYAES